MKKFFNQQYLKYQKYLPSKTFSIYMGGVLGLFIVIFSISYFTDSNSSIFKKKSNLQAENPTVLALIERDTDGDSIKDWEEALWGTDKNNKNTFGMADSTYIENKKKELNIEETAAADKVLTETERFSREFFTAYTAMKASGQVESNAINNFSSILGQKMINPELINRYFQDEIKINNVDTEASRNKYYDSLKTLFAKYSEAGIGDELDIVSNGLITSENTGAENDYAELLLISEAYQEFGASVMSVSVPKSLIDYHLRIANSANNTGISVSNMTKIVGDPVTGLGGLSQYQQYSDDLINAVEDLEKAL